MVELNFINVNWDAPSHIRALSTTRQGGYSKGDYLGFNLGLHVQDEFNLVEKNRALLSSTLSLPSPLCWLNQIHSCTLLRLEANTESGVKADASWTSLKDQPCVVMTADCLPVLITDQQGTFVAAVHAGWRGLCNGIIEQSITEICTKLNINSEQLLVWLGPCISKKAFVVGEEVREEFVNHDPLAAEAFTVYKDRYLADLHHLARLRLKAFNVAQISVSEHCTFNEPELFYSYRREGVTGRMATLIWIDSTS